ncbi:MAG: NAD(P)-binding domain-containing protein [Nocardioidaceae bacterium]
MTRPVGPAPNSLFQQGLRVGKRAHYETDIDRAGQSLVSVALDEAAKVVGPVEGRRICIVGAGSIAALAATSVRRLGASDIVISSRTPASATRLADRVQGRSGPLDTLATELCALICSSRAQAPPAPSSRASSSRVR